MYSRAKDLALPVLAISLPLALVACAWLIGDTARAVVPSTNIVKVRGVAERAIQSDRVNWVVNVGVTLPERDASYARVDETVARVVKYLIDNGVPKDAVKLGSHLASVESRRVVLDKFGNDRMDFIGHSVSQTVSLDGFTDLDLVEKLAKSLTSDLQRQGWPVDANAPYFYFSKKVEEIKPTLLRQASKNAFDRATIVAESSGSRLGPLRAARQGDFEGMGSDGFVGGYTREHRIAAIVTVDFGLR